jgi:alkylation response protein AidB-like acyl-CoA dehydrogenase
MIDFEPSEDQALIVETLHGFAESEIRPNARECDESGKLPYEVITRAHELGLVANSLPEEFGGGGERSAVTGCLIGEELAWGDLAIALAILSPALVALPIADFGSEAQRAACLGRFTGEHFRPAALALVEPNFDFDVFRPRTSARREGDEFVIDGEKCFVPWLDGLEDLLVVARETQSGALQGFLVPTDAPGLRTRREQNMGILALPSVELSLTGVRVDAAARLGGDRAPELREVVNRGRTALAAMAIGVARAAYEVALDYAKQRETFGAPIATRQAIAFKLADMAIEIDGARLLAWEAAWKLDQGEDATRECALAYNQAKRVALEVSDGAVQVFGGYGYIRDYLPEMHLRNAAGFASFECLSLV